MKVSEFKKYIREQIIQTLEQASQKDIDMQKAEKIAANINNCYPGKAYPIKLDINSKESIEEAIKDLESVVKDGDKETIEAKTNALMEASQKLGEKINADAQAQANTESAQPNQDGEKTVDAEVVDAEFEEVKKEG